MTWPAGTASAVKVTAMIVVWPAASGPTLLQAKLPVPVASGATVAVVKASAAESNVSVTGTLASATLPVLLMRRSNVTVSPTWICGSCPIASDFATATSGFVIMTLAALGVVVAGSP